MGYRRASLTHHPPQYVPACHQAGAEGSREIHLPGLVAEPAKAGPQDRCTHHATCRVLDLSERYQGPLPGSIFTKKVTWLTTLQALMEGGGYPGHPVLPEEPLAQVRRHCHARGGPMGGCCNYPQPICQLESHSRSQRREEPHDEVLQEAREAHQWVLEAACMLELNIERLSLGVESTQYQHPHSHSSSCLWSRSLDRHERSPSWHRLERCVTFWDPEVEPVLSKRSYRGPWGHPIGTKSEGGNGGPPPIQRPETVYPQEMPTTYPDIGNRMGYLPEPSIRNYKIWLDWWACQLDTPQWWVEVTAIPKVADPKEVSPENLCFLLDPGS